MPRLGPRSFARDVGDQVECWPRLLIDRANSSDLAMLEQFTSGFDERWQRSIGSWIEEPFQIDARAWKSVG